MKNKILLLFFLGIFQLANSQKSLVGTKAPEINPDEWVYPEGLFASKETKNLTVLDFWFTKCAPCVATIPELNYLSSRYPNIRFLSITFDNKKIIEDFIENVPMYYPIGIDTKHRLINEFKVKGFPETFIIDKNGIIIWQGHPTHLSKALTKLTEKNENGIDFKLSQNNNWNEESSYKLNIKEHTLGMGFASSMSIQPFDITLLNRKVKDVLKNFYGINYSRIITTDTLLFEKSFDVNLKLSDLVVDSKNSMEIFKFHFLNGVGLQYEKIIKSSAIHNLIISDSEKLNTFLSKDKYSGTSIRYDNWESTGVKLKKLKDFFENNYNLIVEMTNENPNHFNFIIPHNDLEAAIIKLENKYGITFKKEFKKTYFYEFKKK